MIDNNHPIRIRYLSHLHTYLGTDSISRPSHGMIRYQRTTHNQTYHHRINCLSCPHKLLSLYQPDLPTNRKQEEDAATRRNPPRTDQKPRTRARLGSWRAGHCLSHQVRVTSEGAWHGMEGLMRVIRRWSGLAFEGFWGVRAGIGVRRFRFGDWGIGVGVRLFLPLFWGGVFSLARVSSVAVG